MEVPEQIASLQQQINDWKGEVDAARQELRSMRGRLEEMAHRKTDAEMLVMVEHFQNQFIRQMEVADEMYHDLKQSAKKISNNGQPRVLHDDRPVDDYDALHDRMQTFHKLYSELKQEFNGFAH